MIDYVQLARELFFQQTFRLFGLMRRVELETPLKLAELIQLALDQLDDDDDAAKKLTMEQHVFLLCEMAEMLDEYFRIGIGNFESTDVSEPTLRFMPELLVGHRVQPFALPEFLLDLTTRVDWENEEPCFRDVAKCWATRGCPR